jgi:ABC-type nitrate/sulfonate/bicarbonate transport system substrate-binding protein
VFAGRAARAQSTDAAIALSSNSFSTVTLRVASRLGMFARHGVNARIITMDNANAATSALLGGSVDFAIAGAGELFAARRRGQDVVLVSNVYRGLSSVVVLAKPIADASAVRPDAPVAERLKALNALTFASPSPTAIFGISVQMAAKQVGASMRMTYIGQTAMPAALESRAIDAMVAGTPFWVTPVLRGAGIPWISCASGELPYDVTPTSSAPLAAMREYAQTHPAVISGVRAALDDIAAFVTNHPDEMQSALAEIYPDLDRQTLALGFAKEWQNWTKPVFTEDDVRHDLAVIKASGLALPGLDTVDPKSLLFP